jgi:predicted metal-dependent phosphoesterase TrpH
MKFRIDLHVHSKFSGDNNSEPEETVLHAINKNLDGIAFTEHYSYEISEYAEKLRETYADRIRVSLKNASVEEVVQVVHEKGGVVIPSHPFRGNNSMGEKITQVKGICALEGYNGYSHHSQNKKAIQAAEELHLPYTGGSDAHMPREAGSCYTEFASEVTHDNFIEMLKEGNYIGVDIRKISRIWPF